MKISSVRAAMTIIALSVAAGCSNSVDVSDDEFDVSVTTKDYQFLDLGEIALDVSIDNATEGTVLVSNMSPDGGGIIDELSWLTAKMQGPFGDHQLKLERRTSEIRRYRDVYSEGDYMIRRREILPVGEDSALYYRLIAVVESDVPISSHSTIQVTFDAPIHDLQIPAGDLQTTETFSGREIVIDEFRTLDYRRKRFESNWASIPKRREELELLESSQR